MTKPSILRLTVILFVFINIHGLRPRPISYIDAQIPTCINPGHSHLGKLITDS